MFPTVGNEATATTVAAGNGLYGLAIAFGDGANATAEGGFGNYALADGTNALAKAGSTTAGATGNNFDSAVDIGNNTAAAREPLTAPTPAPAASSERRQHGTSSNDTAYDFGNNGPDGAARRQLRRFAGDGHLIGAKADRRQR